MKGFTFLSLAAVLAVGPTQIARADPVSVKRVLVEALPNVPGKAMTMVRVTIPPEASPPPHHHAGAVGVYVLRGALRSQIDAGPVRTFKAGETFFEPPGARHALSQNPSATETTELLAVFVADPGATLTTNDR